MYNPLDLSDEQAFLQFCDSIDLTPLAGAVVMVGSEITATIEA